MAVRSAANRSATRRDGCWWICSTNMGVIDSRGDTIGTQMWQSTIFTAWAETNVDLIIKFARIF